MANEATSIKSCTGRLLARLGRAWTRTLTEAKGAREQLRSRKGMLVESARALSWNDKPEEVQAVRHLTEHVIAESALHGSGDCPPG